MKIKTSREEHFFADEYKVEQDITILNNIAQMNFDPKKIAYFEKI
ncbi:MAG: hypothetical protein R2942_20095 [Ignavibacteria bacterium]